MRYIGCKQRLLPFMDQVMNKHHLTTGVFCDLFSGTATVGSYMKQKGFQVISNDWLSLSYVQQQVKVGMNRMPRFEQLLNHLRLSVAHPAYGAHRVIQYLNQLQGRKGFVYQHYSLGGTSSQSIKRMYYSDANAKKIDAIRTCIANWQQQQLINQEEYYLLLFALLEAASNVDNTTGMQMSFLKQLSSNAKQPLLLQVPRIYPSEQTHQVSCQDSLSLVKQLPRVDVLYVDPPYSRKQYLAAYHLLETIACGDEPQVSGIVGLRQDATRQSPFCRPKAARLALDNLVASACYQHLLLSYSSDGLLAHQQILAVLTAYGKVTVYEKPLSRYRSMQRSDPRRTEQSAVLERLYVLQPP